MILFVEEKKIYLSSYRKKQMMEMLSRYKSCHFGERKETCRR